MIFGVTRVPPPYNLLSFPCFSNAPRGGRSLEGRRMLSTAGQNQAVDLVTRPDIENDQRKGTPFIPRMTFLTTVKNIIG